MDNLTLPKSIAPMLAKAGEPFDSGEHLFEVKWDGMRALAYVDDRGYRVVSRHGNDITDRFPELRSLAKLPPGTVLDGELVVLRAGKPSFSLLQTRAPLCCRHKIRALSRTTPATYVVFDQLFNRYRSLMDEPLSTRREVMLETIGHAGQQLFASDGVVGAGRSFYEHVVREQLEGVVAKRLASRYQPGRRTGAWIKIKPEVQRSRLGRRMPQ